MASFAKDSLSPILKNASTRRRSLELCQKIGNQLLSPTNLTTFFSPKQKTPSPAKSEESCVSSIASQGSGRNGFPFKQISDTNNILSPNVFSDGQAQNEVSDSSVNYKRRASDSLWIDTFPKVRGIVEEVDSVQTRRRSLTPLPTYQSTSFFEDIKAKKEDDEPCTSKPHPVITCNIIPPTPAKSVTTLGNKDAPSLECSLKRFSSDSESESDITDCDNGSNTLNKKFKGTEDDSNSYRKHIAAGAKYDLDENFIQDVALRWNLALNPEELLGKGSFGTVVAGTYKGEDVAVKVLKTTNAQKKASLLGEENALKLPFHEHLAKTINIFRIEPDRALIVMEKIHKGSLLHLLNDPTYEVNCNVTLNFCKQIALALIFCHRQGLIHLDVKPQNILVDLHDCCKLSDFGSSKNIQDLNDCFKYSKLEGTVPYTAPELFRGSRPTEKCDVYSYAITMWQILTREMPYEDENEHAVIFRVVSQGLRPKQNIDVNNNYWSSSANEREKMLMEQYIDLYTKAWDSNPEARPTMTIIHRCLIKMQLEFLVSSNDVPQSCFN